MRETSSISLGDHFASFIETQVQAARYRSASEVVRAFLQRMRERRGG